jgi:hypothetical protein
VATKNSILVKLAALAVVHEIFKINVNHIGSSAITIYSTLHWENLKHTTTTIPSIVGCYLPQLQLENVVDG